MKCLNPKPGTFLSYVCMRDGTGNFKQKYGYPETANPPCKKERKMCSEAKPCCPGLKCVNPKPEKPFIPSICLSDGKGNFKQKYGYQGL